MKVLLVDEQGKSVTAPYIIRFPGWTEERYYKEAPREGKCEFVRGDLIIMTPMSGDHSKIIKFLSFLVIGYCEAKGLGEVLPGPTIRLEPGVNREPDICFIPEEKAHLTSAMPIEVIPSFIIEVSCTTRSMDLGEKTLDYEKAGVREYWVVDIERDEVVVHLIEEGKYQKTTLETGRLEAREIPGFYIEVDWLWQEPLPSAFECLRKLVGF